MTRTQATRASAAPIPRTGDRRLLGHRKGAVPAARGGTLLRVETGEGSGAPLRGETGAGGRTLLRVETGEGITCSAGSGEDGGTSCRVETGAGGEDRRRGLLALTLVLAGAVAAAQPLVSPADEAALRGLLPDAGHFELHDRGSRHFRAFAAPEAGAAPRLIGLAFFTTDLAPRIYAYKGRITSLVAMDPGGRLIGVRVVHHYEPFGYFSIDLPGFTPQFAGKSILDPLEVGGDIDAVSRATITVEAATRAIRQGARRLARDFLAEQSADR